MKRRATLRNSIWVRLAIFWAGLVMTSAPVVAGVTVAVNASINNSGAAPSAISPLIYGDNGNNYSYYDASSNFPPTARTTTVKFPLLRLGGNLLSTYNWQIDAQNHDFDYYFESLSCANASTSSSTVTTDGQLVDSFFNFCKNTGVSPMVSLPMFPYIANLASSRDEIDSFPVNNVSGTLISGTTFSQAGFGNQDNVNGNAGSGYLDGNPLTLTPYSNTPNSTAYIPYVPNSSTIQQNFLIHFTGTPYGTANSGGIKYYILDNEPGDWSDTHFDAYPTGLHTAEYLSLFGTYANLVKNTDPNAMVVAPEDTAWYTYFVSGYDIQQGPLDNYADPDLNNPTGQNGTAYYPYLLSQFQAMSTTAGKRLLDYLSCHYYAQSGDVSTDDDSTAADNFRNQSTRELWDPNYVSPYVPNTNTGNYGYAAKVIPLMQGWIASNYPGTKLAITEYSFGDDPNINGATTQADVLGIFGSTGVGMATRYGDQSYTSNGVSFSDLAFQMYLNYDGNGSKFGDMSVSDTVPDSEPTPPTVSDPSYPPGGTYSGGTYTGRDNFASYAAVRSSDGALTVMVINKALSGGATPVTINLSNFSAASNAQAWQLTSTGTITEVNANVAVSNGSISATVPQQSITLFVIPATSSTLTPQTVSFNAIPSQTYPAAGTVTLSATASSGQTPIVYSVVSGPGTISGNTLTITGVGTITVRASQAGNSTYASAYFQQVVTVTAAQTQPGAPAISVTAVTSDNGCPAHQVQWTDSNGNLRTAIMVDQTSTAVGPYSSYTGYLRRYTYVYNGANRTCTGRSGDGGLETSGDGFVQNHTVFGDDNSTGDGTGTGNFTGDAPGTTTMPLQGTNHVMISYNIPGYNIAGQTVPTTVQWFFSNGRNDPIFSISQDATQTAGNLAADTRSPYGDMAYDGDSSGDALVGGAAYGDTYLFQTFDQANATYPGTLTPQSAWNDKTANTIPFAMSWAEPTGFGGVDAEMGHVATVPIGTSDQGQDNEDGIAGDDPRNKSSTSGLPTYYSWAYQINGESFGGALVNNDTYTFNTDDKHVTWGSNWGKVGGYDNGAGLTATSYSEHSNDPIGSYLGGSRANDMLMAYSVFVVLGPHGIGTNTYNTAGAVGSVVTQMQNNALASLSAATGSVVTNGPKGVGNASSASITYSPAGYNPTYAAWELTASGNAVNATLTPANGTTLNNPVFIVDGYTSSQLPSNIWVGTGLTTPGVDYFASIDTATQQLWITVNRAITSPLNLVVTAPSQTGTTAQTITFPAIASQAYSGTAFNLNLSATASSGSPVTFSLVSGPATLNGTVLTITGKGTVEVQANQIGNSTYAAATSVTQSFTVAAALTFAEWLAQPQFTQLTGNNAGLLATPQNDGVTNLLKYFCDINPGAPMGAAGNAALPVGGKDTTTTPGQTYLTITYRQYALATGLTMSVQTSLDLDTWTSVTPAIDEQIGTDPNTSDPIMKVGVNVTGTNTEFVRLRVVAP